MKTKFERMFPSEIDVEGRMRDRLDEDAVVRLMSSIQKIGLQCPVHVRIGVNQAGEEAAILVAGRHRLEALKRLGTELIDVMVISDEREARLWEISENLHRSDLTVQERADHIAEWIKLTGEKLSQDETVSKGGRGNQGGIRAAARDLGISHSEADRAVKISGISPEARAVADGVGLNSQKVRLEIAKEADPEAQVRKVREIADRPSKPAPAIKNAFESEEDWRRALFNVWNRGSQEWRERAMDTLDSPLADKCRATAA